MRQAPTRILSWGTKSGAKRRNFFTGIFGIPLIVLCPAVAGEQHKFMASYKLGTPTGWGHSGKHWNWK